MFAVGVGWLGCGAPTNGEANARPHDAEALPPVATDASPPPLTPTTPATSPPPPPPPTTAPTVPSSDAWTACFGDQWTDPPPVDYATTGAVVAAHCAGTDHQEIGVPTRVVFVGDSITAGSLPTLTDFWYRNVLADAMVAAWGLEAPSALWRNVDPFEGETIEQESGSFASCAKYGARTDDLLLAPHQQLPTCLPEDRRDEPTLVIMTVGGNDLFSLLEDVNAGIDEATLRATYDAALAHLRDAVAWVADERAHYPNGLWLVFANTYDFTDAHGAEDMARCPGAGLIGLDVPLRNPLVWDILGRAQEEYLRIAADTGTDMVFLGEGFCGHGYAADDAGLRCFRGPDALPFLDVTCMHPRAEGHSAIASGMLAVIAE